MFEKIYVRTWCISMIIILPIILAISSNTSQGTLQYDTVRWKLDLETASKPYTDFLSSLRGKLKAGEVCKFPVTTKTPASNKKFILIDIIDTKPQPRTITLALRASDAYFLGFRDEFNGVPRANFVEDDFAEWKASDVFNNVKEANKKKLPFQSSYDSMESAAKLVKGRKGLPIGIQNLDDLIEQIYGKPYKGISKSNEEIGVSLAKFGLTVVQMVAEAVRFKYIEDAVVKEGIGKKKSFKPGDDIISLVKEWGKISQAIHVSAADKKACEKISGFDYPKGVTTVDGIRNYVSLVKFKKSKVSNTTVDAAAVVTEVAELAFM